jgi:predicted Zn-dependent peptidase
MAETYRKTVLGNGIRVVSENMEHGRAVSVGVWVQTGSRYESKKQNGISHLLEHMLFKGTSSRTAYDIAVSLESVGGHLNAFTEREFTCFYALVLDENLRDAVDVIADVVQNAVLDKEDLRNEQQIVFEELRNLEDTPEDFLHDYFFRSVFGNHPLGFSTLGTYEAVGGINRSDLLSYRENHYHASNIIVAAAGCLDHEHLVDLASEFFGATKNGSSSIPESALFGEKTSEHIKYPIKQAHVCTGTPAFSYKDQKKYPLIVLNAVLGGGMSSRLFQNLREEKGLAYAVYSFLELWSDAGLLGIYAGISSQNIDKTFRLIDEELTRLCDKKIPDEELSRVKSQLTRSLILSTEDCTTRMNRLAKTEAHLHAFVPVEEVISRVEAVSSDDVRLIAEEIFRNQNKYTTILEPEVREAS